MDDVDYPWQPGAGSEAQNIIRQAEAPPDSPFRPRSRRRSSGEVVAPPPNGPGALGAGAGGAGSGQGLAAAAAAAAASLAAVEGMGGGDDRLGVEQLSVLLGKQPVAEALASFLTLRDVFKTGSSCRLLMNILVLCGTAAPAVNGSAAEGAANGGSGGGAGGGEGVGEQQEGGTRP